MHIAALKNLPVNSTPPPPPASQNFNEPGQNAEELCKAKPIQISSPAKK
jgi:hypothetical protein